MSERPTRTNFSVWDKEGARPDVSSLDISYTFYLTADLNQIPMIADASGNHRNAPNMELGTDIH